MTRALAHSIMLPVAVLVGVAFIMVLILLHMDAVLLGSILQGHQRLKREERKKGFTHTTSLLACLLQHALSSLRQSPANTQLGHSHKLDCNTIQLLTNNLLGTAQYCWLNCKGQETYCN